MSFFDGSVPLDQSKAEPNVTHIMSPTGPVGVTDSDLRLLSMRMALQAHAHPSGQPEEVIETTRDFYLFLIGEDPIVDITFEEEDAEKPSAEIIPLREVQRLVRKDDE